MDEEIQQKAQRPEPKIDLVTGILITLAMVVLDILEIIPFVGDVTSVFAFGVLFYLKSVGVGGTVFLIGNILDFIPGVQAFPCKTIAWLITWALDHFAPKTVRKVEKVGEITQTVEGKGGGIEGEAGAATTTAMRTERAAAGTVEVAEGGVREVSQTQRAEGAAAGGAEGAETGIGAEAPGGPAGREEAGGEEAPETPEEIEKEKELKEIFEQGAMKSPEEEMEEQMFNPKETQFHEASGKGEEGVKDEDEEEAGEAGGTATAVKKAKKSGVTEEGRPEPPPPPMSPEEKKFFAAYEDQMNKNGDENAAA